MTEHEHEHEHEHEQNDEVAERTVKAGTELEYLDSQVEVRSLIVGPIANNVYVVRCRQSGEAVLIDAANEHGRLLEVCTALGVRRIVETHGHWDHIGAVEQLRDAGYHVGVANQDAAMLPSYDEILEDDEVINVGALRLRTIATPGHTPGSLCYLIEGSPVLFSGDTLFPGGPGATHFPGGDFPTIMRSIEERLMAPLDDSTIVMPGHGENTTIGHEKPNIDAWANRGW